MGLDMYLFRKEKNKKFGVNVEIAYWRKAYAINDWFARNVSDSGIENDEPYIVTKEHLENLRDTCQKVWDIMQIRDGIRRIVDEKKTAELLPAGYFENGHYDEYYAEDVRDTIKQLNKVLDTVDFDKYDVYYYVWQ